MLVRHDFNSYGLISIRSVTFNVRKLHQLCMYPLASIFHTCNYYRQPQTTHRPTFPQLVELLSRADFELFSWEEEDMVDCDPLAKVIGAPLETSKNLYKALQMSYQQLNLEIS